MVRAALTLTIPRRVWIGAVSREFPDARFQVRSAQSCDGVGVGFVELVADDPDAVCDAIEAADDVRAVEIFQRTDDRALLQLEADAPLLLRVLDRTGVPIETPFEITDGEVHWTLTTTRSRLSTLADYLDDSDLDYVVDRIQDSTEFDQVLTDRQQEVVAAAIERGYYDSPRRCTQEELADHLGLAKSTCSETLHRAEERILKTFTDDARPTLASPELTP